MNQLINSDIKVKLNISLETKIERQLDGTHYTYGETIQGNYDSKDNYGKKINGDGTYSIKEATITIYEGTIVADAKTKNPKHIGLNTDQAIGAVVGHEIVHATDKNEINKDLKADQLGGSKEKARLLLKESKPNQVEAKIIEQSKYKN